MARKVKVHVHPVSEAYSGPDEKRIEFSTPDAGGIVTFTVDDDGFIHITVGSVNGKVEVNGLRITPTR